MKAPMYGSSTWTRSKSSFFSILFAIREKCIMSAGIFISEAREVLNRSIIELDGLMKRIL